MPTILITGGTGLIGTALTQLLIEKGHTVILLSPSTPPAAAALPPNNDSAARRPNASLPAQHGTQPVPARFHWSRDNGSIDPHAIRREDHINHQAGAGVADRR